MTDKSALSGLSTNETIVLAAAFLCSRSADIDYEKMYGMAGSKSVGAVRERLRLAKKKGEQLFGSSEAASTPTAVTAKKRKACPAGYVDRNSHTKVNTAPRKAKQPKVKAEVDEDAEEADEEDGV